MRLTLAAALALALATAGCGSQDSRPLANLQAMPEAQLSFPGATSLGDLNFDQTTSIEGQQPAETGHEFGANASAGDITAFYNQELAARGWRPTNLYAGPATTESGALAWQKGQVVMRLSFRKKGDDPRLPSASDQARYTTIYRAVLIDQPESATSREGS